MSTDKFKKIKDMAVGLSGGRMKAKAALTALVIFLISSAALGGTYAYLTANTTPAANDFTIGIPAVTVREPSVDPAAVLWGAGTKPVTLSIPAGSMGGAVRAAIIPMLKDSTGNIISTPTGALTAPTVQATDATLVLGEITLHFAIDWETSWFYKDGYFYYRKVLNEGETTPAILTGVTLTDNTAEMTAKYQDIVVEIEVMSDVLQSTNEALALWGVKVDGDGNISAA